MTASPENLLVCSIGKKIYAFNKIDDSQVWSTKLSGVGDGVGALFVLDNKIYVGLNGYLIALKLDNGAEVWRNPLKGMGYSEVSVLVANPNSAYETKRSIVIVASSGNVCGIESESGGTLWKNELKGGGYGLPCLMLNSSAPDIVLVGCGKRLYKINIYNGETISKHELSKNTFSSSYVTMATHQSSLQAAFTHTGFNNNPIAQYVKRQEDGSGGGG